MKHSNRIELVGTIKNVNIRRCNNAKRAKLYVKTEDIKLQIPIIVWEGNNSCNLDLLTIGTDVHIIGKLRVTSQSTAYCVEKNGLDIIANKVEII